MKKVKDGLKCNGSDCKSDRNAKRLNTGQTSSD